MHFTCRFLPAVNVTPRIGKNFNYFKSCNSADMKKDWMQHYLGNKFLLGTEEISFSDLQDIDVLATSLPHDFQCEISIFDCQNPNCNFKRTIQTHHIKTLSLNYLSSLINADMACPKCTESVKVNINLEVFLPFLIIPIQDNVFLNTFSHMRYQLKMLTIPNLESFITCIVYVCFTAFHSSADNKTKNRCEATGSEVTGDTIGTNVTTTGTNVTTTGTNMMTGTNVMTSGTNVMTSGTNVTATWLMTEENEKNGNSKLLRELDDGENCEIRITNDLVKRIDNYVYQIQPECIKPILEDMKPLIIEVVSGTRKNWRHDVVTGKRIEDRGCGRGRGGVQVKRHHLDHMSPCL